MKHPKATFLFPFIEEKADFQSKLRSDSKCVGVDVVVAQDLTTTTKTPLVKLL